MPDAVLTPMLLWSVAFIEQFADDILTALAAVRGYEPDVQSYATVRQTDQFLIAWMDQHGELLPWTDSSSGGIALSYMCFILNWPIRFQHVNYRLSKFPELMLSDNPSCPIPTRADGRIHGKRWQPNGLDYYRLIPHQNDLQSACLFLLGLNSSMRPEELLELEVETYEDDGTKRPVTERVQAPDGQVRHLLYGRTFKGQDGVDRTQRADGVSTLMGDHGVGRDSRQRT